MDWAGPVGLQILLPTGNPILLGIWIIIAVGGTYAYFVYLPSTYASESEVPPYVQVGPPDSLMRACAYASRLSLFCKR